MTSRPRDVQTMNRFPGQEGNIPQDPQIAANPLQKSPREVKEDDKK